MPSQPDSVSSTVEGAHGQVDIRPLTCTDRPAVQAMHRRCSVQTMRWRCLQVPARSPAGDVADALVDWMFDLALGHTLVATHGDQVVGIGHVMHAEPAGAGDIGLLVEDAWQGQRLGTALLDLITELAGRTGFRRLHADVSLDNQRMLHMLGRRGWSLQVQDGLYVLDRSL